MKKIIYILFSLFTFLHSQYTFAQIELDSLEQNSKVIIQMNDGEEYTGTITEKSEKSIRIKTDNAEIILSISNIKSITKNTYEGDFRFANPHSTRYFFSPTGKPIEKGKAYYQNILLVGNFVNFGVGKNISVGGGLEFISTMYGEPIWFLTPKIGFEITENFHVATGLFMAGVTDEGSASLLYSVGTYGNNDANVSLGIGYGLVDGSLSDIPAITISGSTRVTNGLALLTENYFIDGFYFGIQGLRLLGKKSAFDIGVFTIAEAPIPIPFVGYSRAF